MEQNRFKSPVLWAALAAQLLSMLVLLVVLLTIWVIHSAVVA